MKYKVLYSMLFFLLCVGLFFLAVSHSLSFPFHYDDIPNVVFNRSIRYLEHPRAFIETLHQRLRPIVNISYAIDYALNGLSVSQYRSTNFFLHGLNIFLFLLLAMRIFCWRFFPAAIAVMIFSFHPLVVESAIYISGRSILLATSFSLLAIHIYLLNPKFLTQLLLQWIVFFTLVALAFFSKESAAFILLLLLPLLYWKHEKKKTLLLFLTPVFMLTLIFLKVKWGYLQASWAGFFRYQAEIHIYHFWEFLRFQLSLWPRMFRFFIDPSSFSIDHEVANPNSWFSLLVVCGIFLFLSLPIFAWYFRKKNPALFLGIFWVFFALLPTNFIFPVLDPLAERHLYIALPGFSLIIGSIFLFLKQKKQELIFLCFVFLISIGTLFEQHARADIWKNSATLWRNAYEKYPEKFRIVLNTMIGTRQIEQNYEGAFQILIKFWKNCAYGSLTYNEQDQLLQHTAFTALLLAKQDVVKAQDLIREAFGEDKRIQFWEKMSELRVLKIKKQYVEMEKLLISMEANPWKKWSEPLKRKNQFFFEDYLKLVKVQIYLSKNEWQKIIDILEPILSRTAKDYPIVMEESESLDFLDNDNNLQQDNFVQNISPFWPALEILGAAYEATGQGPKAQEKWLNVSNHWKTFNVYSETLWRKVAASYEENKDYYRAADAYGELVKVFTDDVELRKKYAELLYRIPGDKALAMARRQEQEASYYEMAQQKISSEKELVRP